MLRCRRWLVRRVIGEVSGVGLRVLMVGVAWRKVGVVGRLVRRGRSTCVCGQPCRRVSGQKCTVQVALKQTYTQREADIEANSTHRSKQYAEGAYVHGNTMRQFAYGVSGRMHASAPGSNDSATIGETTSARNSRHVDLLARREGSLARSTHCMVCVRAGRDVPDAETLVMVSRVTRDEPAGSNTTRHSAC